jgi:hypothetical protein
LPTGPKFRSIGQLTFLTKGDDAILSTWWLSKKSDVAD